MIDKDLVVISRKWNNPNIHMLVNVGGISISMAVSDFIKAVSLEVGNPSMLFTNAALSKAMDAASVKVLTEMKQESKKVM